MARPPKERVDALLVARGLAPDLAKAGALIMAGQVVVGERRADKAGERVPLEAPLRVKGRKAHAYVSRGGVKLAGALDHFGVDPTSLVGLDLGASTGGFTDCLLQRGARRVYAVDVGYGLLDWTLQTDDRVVNLERTHAKDLTVDLVPEPVDLLVADISFNTLGRLLAPAVPLLAPTAQALLLVKPQFELDAADVGEGGIVRDPAAWDEACRRVAAAVVEVGLTPRGTVRSRLECTRGGARCAGARGCPPARARARGRRCAARGSGAP